MKATARLSALAVALSAALPGGARALSEQAGTSAAQFLKIGAGARGAAMAEANAALADDAYAAYYNPAGLALATQPMLGAMHAQYFQGTNFEYGSFLLPLGDGAGYPRKVVALSLANLGVSGLERRTEDTDLNVGLFDAADYTYAASFAYAPDSRTAFGMTGKIIREKIDVVSGNAFAFDFGARYRVNVERKVDLAVVARNLGTGLALGDGPKDPLPSAYVIGAAVEPVTDLKLELDAIQYRDNHPLVALGGEYTTSLMGALKGTLRAGFNNARDNIDGTKGITLGAGLSFPSLSFDFAWVPFGDLGNTFRYSLLVRF